MKKKYILLVFLAFIIPISASNFAYVKAEANTSICAWPSETMSLYFDFQNDMKSVLLSWELNERRFAVQAWKGWLFSRQLVTLTTDTAIDLVANSLWNRTRSVVSNATTSVVLIALASASTLQSATEWWTILFRDKPIVRDYKTMMDIETELFDVAYFRSKQVNIVRPVDWNMHDAFKAVVEEYQDLWLLATGNNIAELKSDATIVDIIWDLLVMNATMKQFILFPAGLDLKNYQGCMNRSRGDCTPVLKFNKEAIEQLKSDYKWTFGKCNSNFKESMSKIGASFLGDQKSGWQDVKDAMGRLKEALVSWWKWWSKKDRACDLSDYEMAQIRAYRWNDWTCGEAIKLYESIPDVKIKKSDKALKKQKKNSSSKSSKSSKGEKKSNDRIKNKKTTVEMKQEWLDIYGEGCEFNTEYSSNMDDDFLLIYRSVMEWDEQIMNSAQSSDLSRELVEIDWLIKQIKAVEDQSKKLENSLKKVADYQCSG